MFLFGPKKVRPAPRPRRTRLEVECLGDRTLPSAGQVRQQALGHLAPPPRAEIAQRREAAPETPARPGGAEPGHRPARRPRGGRRRRPPGHARPGGPANAELKDLLRKVRKVIDVAQVSPFGDLF
jgi:hypothetical protein